MARRIDIELTSKRDDGAWTWRAAGAREPKGTVDGGLLPPAPSVGDTFKVEVEGFLDGITITAVIPPKAGRSAPERIELLAPRSDSTLVTTQLARKPRREDDRRDRRGGGRDSRGGERNDRDRDRDRRGPRNERSDRGDRDRDRDRDRRRERPTTPPVEAKPKPKRLRPAKVHRAALLEALPAEQRPIAEQLLQGGIPAVRQAIEKQNEELKAAGKAQVSPEPLLEVAEKLRHKAQTAVWRDRADAALSSVDDLDLRDLRSVVNAAGDAGRDTEARAVADQLREALANRVEKEQSAWVAEVAENLQEGRVVRALRLSSRPPKAGSPLPGNLAEQLITDTNAALTADTTPQRWATVIDALAFSPIRRRVVPDSLPDKLPADLRELIAKVASRLPEIAHIFAIEPSDAPSRPRPPRRKPADAKGPKQRDAKSKPRPPKPPKADDKATPAPADTEAKAEAPEVTEATVEAPAAEVTEATAEAPAAEVTEATTDAPVAETSETTSDEPAAEDTEATVEAPAAEDTEPTTDTPAAEVTEEPTAEETEAAVVEAPEAEATSEAPAEVSEPEAPAESADEAGEPAAEATASA